MKVAVVILVILGLVAAGAAAVLFQALHARPGPTPVLDVVLAQTDLPARTRLTSDQLKVERVPRTGLPLDCFSDPAQAIGRTLKVAVVKGQTLTASCFLPETAIDDLLRPGMLAFQITLGHHATAMNLLYPGCIVDVFATFPLQDRKKGDAVTTPLLQNIQVLAVRDETVISASEEKNGSILSKKSTGSTGDVTVALEVTARQAAALQLVQERGTLGLAMRNPLDRNLNPTDPMVVKEGQLAASSEAMDPQTLALVNQLQTMLGNRPVGDVNTPAVVPAVFETSRPMWLMTVIRGPRVQELEMKRGSTKEREAPLSAGRGATE